MSEGRLWTVREVALRLGMHPQTVRKLIREEVLVGFRFGRAYKVFDSDFKVFIEAHRVSRSRQGYGDSE